MKLHRIKFVFGTVAAALVLATPSVNAGQIGGTSGGGGNVMLSDQVANGDFYLAIRRARYSVKAWLSQAYLDYQKLKDESACGQPHEGYQCKLFGKLFDSAPTAFDLLETTEVEMKANAPCYDAEKNPSDGSIYGTKPGSICLSVASMREKLRYDNYNGQVAALALHEISHLKGTTEQEAIDLQDMMLDVLSVANTSNVLVHGLMVSMFVEDLGVSLNEWSKALQGNPDFAGSCRATEKKAANHAEFFDKHIGLTMMRLVTPAEAGNFWSAYQKVRALQDYICAQDAYNLPADRAEAERNYNANFGDQTEIPSPSYKWSSAPAEEARSLRLVASPLVKIKKVENREEFFAEVADTIAVNAAMVESVKATIESEFHTYKTK